MRRFKGMMGMVFINMHIEFEHPSSARWWAMENGYTYFCVIEFFSSPHFLMSHFVRRLCDTTSRAHTQKHEAAADSIPYTVG